MVVWKMWRTHLIFFSFSCLAIGRKDESANPNSPRNNELPSTPCGGVYHQIPSKWRTGKPHTNSYFENRIWRNCTKLENRFYSENECWLREIWNPNGLLENELDAKGDITFTSCGMVNAYSKQSHYTGGPNRKGGTAFC